MVRASQVPYLCSSETAAMLKESPSQQGRRFCVRLCSCAPLDRRDIALLRAVSRQ
jgi:hypothetical protein